MFLKPTTWKFFKKVKKKKKKNPKITLPRNNHPEHWISIISTVIC